MKCPNCNGTGQYHVTYCDLGCWGMCYHVGLKRCGQCSGRGELKKRARRTKKKS